MPEIENAGTAPRTLDRRTVVKGAAWAVPVIAAAAATPLAAASTAPNWDVTVSGTCVGEVYTTGPVSGPILSTLLGFIGRELAQRRLTITVTEGPLPQDTVFTLQHGGLLNANLLSPTGIVGVTVIGLGSNATQITIPAGTPAGSVLTIDLLSALVDASALSNITLSLNGSDNPSTAPGGANSATVSTLAGITATVPSWIPVIGGLGYGLQACNNF